MALKRSYHTANNEFLKIAEQQQLHDGSTGLCSVIRNGKLLVGNVGDCRCLLLSSGKVIQMSVDQKPTNTDEMKRIISLGGNITNNLGVARVNGVLAVSRAFGNRRLRKVIRPDIEMMQRDLTREDHFLVIASDGLWDVLRNKDVCDICYTLSQSHCPQQLAEELVHTAIARGSMDNVTCIVVKLVGYIAKWNADLRSESSLEGVNVGPSDHWNTNRTPQSVNAYPELSSLPNGQNLKTQPPEDFTPETWDDGGQSHSGGHISFRESENNRNELRYDTKESSTGGSSFCKGAALNRMEPDQSNYEKVYGPPPLTAKFPSAAPERAPNDRNSRPWQFTGPDVFIAPDGYRNSFVLQAHAPNGNGMARCNESPIEKLPPSYFDRNLRQRFFERVADHRDYSRNQEGHLEEGCWKASPSACDASHMAPTYGIPDGPHFAAQHCVIQSATRNVSDDHLPNALWATTCVQQAPHSSNEAGVPIRVDGGGGGSRESKDGRGSTAAFDKEASSASALSSSPQQSEGYLFEINAAVDLTSQQQRPREAF
jgi:serine/threonine protein phosphatase PrpC